jgi:putative NADPH-quinone reductase
MNILYVNGHPYEKSFHGAIEKSFTKNVSSHHSLEVLSLGKETFDPVLRFGYSKRMPKDPFIERSKELVQWADHIVFSFPIWWGVAPSLLHGWIDRVISPGQSYQYEGMLPKPLLKPKTADIIVTYRAFKPMLWVIGVFGISVFMRNIFLVTGLRKKKVLRLGGISLHPAVDTQKRREAFLTKVSRRAAQL